MSFFFFFLNLSRCSIWILSLNFPRLYILFSIFDFTMNSNPYQGDRYMSLLVCHYETPNYTSGWYRFLRFACMRLLCFYRWPNLLNLKTVSREPDYVFRNTVHVFANLFLKIRPLFGQILITCLKCSRAFFSLSSYSEKMRWGRGWILD